MAQAVAIVVALIILGVGAFFAADVIRKRRTAKTAANVYALVASGLTDGFHASALVLPAVAEDAEADLWEDLESRLDISSFRPKLAEDVEIRIFRLRWGNDYAMAANPRDLVHLNLEIWEAELAGLMDGTRTVGDLIVERFEHGGDLHAEAVTDLVQILGMTGFLEPREQNIYELLGEEMQRDLTGRRLRRFASTFVIDWGGMERVTRALYKAFVHWFFNPVVAAITALVALAGLGLFLEVQHQGHYKLGGRAAPLDSLLLIVLGWVLTFAHEAGHASVLIHKKRRIKTAGFMLYFGSPAFFVDASDGLMLDPRDRIMQSFAGPFAELIIAGACSILLFILPHGPVGELLYRFALLNYFVILLNLVPLLELDGYWILSDVIQVPDLRPRSLEFTQHDLWHKLRRRERFSPQEVGLAAYGIAGVLFTIFVIATSVFFWRETFGNLILSLWHGGAVSRVLLVLLVLAIAGPLVRGLVNLVFVLFKRLRGIWRTIRFRLQSGWRVEAAELIDALPAFEDLPTDVLNDVAGRVSLHGVRVGQPVARQGDRATAFYVIRRGTFGVESEDATTGDKELLSTLGRGDSFGEIGLLNNARRQATVRALTDGEVFALDKGSFDRLLADTINAPEFGHTLQALAELRELPPFASLGTDQLSTILAHGGWVSFGPGDDVMRQGEVGDAFYAIASGQADVIIDGAYIDTLGPGAHAGEVALLRHAPRNATIQARTPLRAFRLDRDGFDEVISQAFVSGTLRIAGRRTWEHWSGPPGEE